MKKLYLIIVFIFLSTSASYSEENSGVVKNSDEAKKWFSWGFDNGITIFSWPDLSIDNVKNNSRCFKRWKKLVCLPLDMPNHFLKKICN